MIKLFVAIFFVVFVAFGVLALFDFLIERLKGNIKRCK